MDEEMARVPAGHRKTMAKWLLERAEQYRPSMLLSGQEADLIQGVLTGIAVDVMDPESEDMTTAHAARIIGALQA